MSFRLAPRALKRWYEPTIREHDYQDNGKPMKLRYAMFDDRAYRITPSGWLRMTPKKTPKRERRA